MGIDLKLQWDTAEYLLDEITEQANKQIVKILSIPCADKDAAIWNFQRMPIRIFLKDTDFGRVRQLLKMFENT